MRAVGEQLAGPLKGDRSAARRVAEALGMSTSWARKQGRRVEWGESPARPGRPSLSAEARARVRALVEAERVVQGSTAGWRPIFAGVRRVDPKASRMLVEQELSALKRAERASEDRERAEQRKSLEVQARDALWGGDTTHLGRDAQGEKVEGEVLKDLGTQETVGLSVGGVPSSQDALAAFTRAAEERGGPPLVVMHDRGSIYRTPQYEAVLEREMVVHLFSRVHTPQDNAATEHQHAEIKGEAGLGRGVRLGTAGEADARAQRARRTLDEGRLRATLGWRTAAQVGRELPRADALVDRATFYREACAAMDAAALGLTCLRAVLHARREALFATLERFGLARRHVGRRPRVRPGPGACSAPGPGVECPGAQASRPRARRSRHPASPGRPRALARAPQAEQILASYPLARITPLLAAGQSASTAQREADRSHADPVRRRSQRRRWHSPQGTGSRAGSKSWAPGRAPPIMEPAYPAWRAGAVVSGFLSESRRSGR